MLLSVSMLIVSSEGGKVLFWSPFGTKSTKITYMPMLEELAKRGHEITVVHPSKMKQPVKGITEIMSSDKVDKFLGELSRFVKLTVLNLKLSNVSLKSAHYRQLIRSDEPPGMPFMELIELGMEGNKNALNDPKMKKLLKDTNTKFDVVITAFFAVHEAGYYLAHRFQAQLAFYCTGQVSIPMIDHAMGMPHHTGVLPLPLLDYEPYKMTFWQRTINTIASNIMELGR